MLPAEDALRNETGNSEVEMHGGGAEERQADDLVSKYGRKTLTICLLAMLVPLTVVHVTWWVRGVSPPYLRYSSNQLPGFSIVVVVLFILIY